MSGSLFSHAYLELFSYSGEGSYLRSNRESLLMRLIKKKEMMAKSENKQKVLLICHKYAWIVELLIILLIFSDNKEKNTIYLI